MIIMLREVTEWFKQDIVVGKLNYRKSQRGLIARGKSEHFRVLEVTDPKLKKYCLVQPKQILLSLCFTLRRKTKTSWAVAVTSVGEQSSPTEAVVPDLFPVVTLKFFCIISFSFGKPLCGSLAFFLSKRTSLSSTYNLPSQHINFLSLSFLLFSLIFFLSLFPLNSSC